MIQFDLPKEKSSILKVIGVGGGGSNAVNYMFSQNIEGVNFIICNTDAQAIAQSRVPNKVQLGPNLTQGLGAGANPEIGRQATEESLEEIRRILEVNTKMAFITAGMGGGTGTGGAPIISKICKDLDILTVGIVTTPFSYEGKKRQLQADEGIRNMKQYVDTLLVISNDKLRHQFGNLKMKDAFAKADNVLATAAKCITDVINSTGQINVDFADVCTVMRNGGVAILGSADAKGENRAQKAIEEALNSPLLNDNDIRGAKWILININSAEGEYEFTMDEVDIIQSYLISRAGEETDIILGMGYDNTLGDRIGITLIATGFEHREPGMLREAVRKEKQEEDKIVMVLDMNKPTQSPQKEEAPIAVEKPATETEKESDDNAGSFPQALQPVLVEEQPTEKGPKPLLLFEETKPAEKMDVDKKTQEGRVEWILSLPQTSGQPNHSPSQPQTENLTKESSSASAASGGYLAKPTNIYAEQKAVESNVEPSPVKEQGLNKPVMTLREEPAAPEEMQLVFRNDIPSADEPGAYPTQSNVSGAFSIEDPALQDEVEEQKRKAQERIQKLRNLSFNTNASDPNNEFETVPAYVRRSLEFQQPSTPESFYSKYEVVKEEDSSRLTRFNTFLEGKKPD
jgi:cell division protein FtsZ